MPYPVAAVRGKIFGNVPLWYLASGITPLAAYQSKGADSYAASLVNLANPGTYDLSEGNGAVTWSATNGWQFTAAQSKYFNTGIVVPGTGWSILVQFASATVDGFLMGASDGVGTEISLRPLNGGANARYANGGNTTVAPALASGNVAVAGQVAYRNGMVDGGAISAWTGANTRSLFVGCRDLLGVAGNYITANILAIIIYNATYTPAQVATLVTNMAAL